MKHQPLDKLLFLFAITLLISGAIERLLHLSEHHVGLYLMLSGLLIGLFLILHNMRKACEQEQQTLNKHQLEKK